MLSEKVCTLSHKKIEQQEFEQITKAMDKVRGNLFPVAQRVALGFQGIMDLQIAIKKALTPDIALVWEVSADNCLQWIVNNCNFQQANTLNKEFGWVDEIALENDGLLAIWVLPDDSAILHFSGSVQQLAINALKEWGVLTPSNTTDSTQYYKNFSYLWKTPLGESVGERLQLNQKELLLPLSKEELEDFIRSFPCQYSKEKDWQKGLTVKNHFNGNNVSPESFKDSLSNSLNKNKQQLRDNAQKRLDEIKKEQEAKLKTPWHDTVIEWIKNIDSVPVYDGGLVGFLMSKPNLYGQYPKSYWQRALKQLNSVLQVLKEGDSPELDSIIAATSHLGSDVSNQIAHFMYRFHRTGGAKSLSLRVLEQNKARILEESKIKTGLAALINKKDDPVSEETRESTRSASSIEFAVQYGSSMALNSALWGLETAFQSPHLQARVFLRSMRGAGEISLESFGWFARLMYELSDGFLSKQAVEEILMDEMKKVSDLEEEMRLRGGKIGLENEWSGKWGMPLARRKVREYLGLTQSEHKNLEVNFGSDRVRPPLQKGSSSLPTTNPKTIRISSDDREAN